MGPNRAAVQGRDDLLPVPRRLRATLHFQVTFSGTGTGTDTFTDPLPNLAPHSMPSRTLSLPLYVWGIGGVLLSFVHAIVTLTPRAWAPIASGSLTTPQIVIYVGWVIVNAYGEGYRALHRKFCPRVVARAYHLAQHPTPLPALLAPFYCFSLFHASRRGLLKGWLLIAMIATFIVLLHFTPQPWRGIVDGGVIVALAWGALALLVLAARALRSGPPDVEMELPEEAASPSGRLSGSPPVQP
jgi:hypothetical protein